ncbi:MAG: SPOR domain-containing protein [Bacteroidales bacterium]|nr:SPOR domain-containing protein [Bacteroidales bacterium]
MRKLLTVILATIIFCLPVFAQDPDFVPDRDIAERAFNNEDYTTALKHYRALLDRFSADPVYKYHTGACMVELNENPDRAKLLIDDAIINSSSIRQVPSKAWYFLGRAYQLSGDFDLAAEAYNTFKGYARRKEIKALGINELIEECEEGIGEIQQLEPETEEEKTDKVVEEELQEQEEDAVRPSIMDDVIKNDTADADLKPALTAVDKYETLAREALGYQFKADSLLRLADRYRATLHELSESDKQTVRAKILSLEQSAFEYQKIADEKYKEVAGMASEKYNENILPELRDIEEEVHGDVKENMPDTNLVRTDSVRTDTLPEVVERIPPVLKLFSEQYDKQEEIPVNPELPEGLIYSIQMAAFRNPKDFSFFKGLGPITIFRADNSDINFYYAGMFRSKEDADQALVKVKQKGFSDAFIIALMDGSRTSLEKAEQHEKKWSDISLFKQDTLIKDPEPQEPPTLVYRVQVMKVKKKIQDDELELIERLADQKSYDIFETASKEYVYLIGKFLTFESAAAYADLLYRNGMKDSKVVAYLGEKEIPLETAKKIFDLYFEK